MAKAGADIIVAHVGTTLKGTIGARNTISLDESVVAIQAMHDAAKEAIQMYWSSATAGPR